MPPRAMPDASYALLSPGCEVPARIEHASSSGLHATSVNLRVGVMAWAVHPGCLSGHVLTEHACLTSLLAHVRTPTTAELLRAAYSAGSARAQGQMAAAHDLSAVANGAAHHGHAMSPSGVPLRRPPACMLEESSEPIPPVELSCPPQVRLRLL